MLYGLGIGHCSVLISLLHQPVPNELLHHVLLVWVASLALTVSFSRSFRLLLLLLLILWLSRGVIAA